MLVDDQHAGRDAGAVEQVARQTDDRFEDAVLDEPLTAGFFLAAPEEDAVRHDHGQLAVALERGDHVLNEHQVGLLAALRHEVREPLLELHALGAVVLREGRIGNHPVETADFATPVQMQGLLERVALTDVRAADAVQQHVHLANGPGAAVEFLPGQFEIAGIAADLLHVLLGLDQHAPRPAGRIIDRHAFRWLDQLDQEPDDLGRRVKLAPLLPGAVGEVLDQVFVRGSQQVWELEVIVAQGQVVEVLDELDQGAVIQGPLADPAIEVDAFENVLEGVRVGVFDGGEGLVQTRADRRFQVRDSLVSPLVVDEVPPGLVRHEEVVLVRVGQLLLDQLGLHPPGFIFSPKRLAILLELVIQPLQEEHAEDEFLELRGVHVAPEDVAGREELRFELRQRELGRLSGGRRRRGHRGTLIRS